MSATIIGPTDSILERIAANLRSLNGDVCLYRSNRACVNIRIVDAAFSGVSNVRRHELVWPLLEQLADDDLGDVNQLLLLTPHEARSSVGLEFDERADAAIRRESSVVA